MKVAAVAILAFTSALAPCTVTAASTFASRINTYSGLQRDAGIFGIKLGDLNRDGKLDVVGTSSGSGLFIGLGNGDGTFRVAPLIGTAIGIDLSVDISDLTGDGILDIVACSNGSSNIYILRGNGDGTFQEPQALGLGGDLRAGRLAVGDFNGDGSPDIAVVLINTAAVLLFFEGVNQERGQFARFSYSLSEIGKYVVAGDLDLDGKTDIGVLTDSKMITLRNLYNIGNPEVGEISGIGRQYGGKAAIGNIYGPGKLPSILLSKQDYSQYGSATSTIYLQQRWDSPGVLSVVSGGGDLERLVIADLDLDGYGEMIYGDELVSISGDTYAVHILYTSDGTVSDSQVLNSHGPAIAVGDVNNDGLPDIVASAGDFGHDVSVHLQQAIPGHPVITSANQATFFVGQFNEFQPTASGSPAPTIKVTGSLPAGVTLGSNGYLSGAPGAAAAGVYPLVITATNGLAPGAMQNFTLTVGSAPPTVTNPFFDTMTNSSAHLYGTVASETDLL
jgi:hypothetical protein